MLDFSFSEDHESFRKTIAAFTTRELLPGYTERSASTEFPYALLKKIGDLGVLGIGLPEKFGGTGEDDPVLLGLATETLAYGDVNLASAPIQVGLVGAQLLDGSELVQERYLPTVISGDENLAIALTEPGSGCECTANNREARPRRLDPQRREDRDQLGDHCNGGARLRARRGIIPGQRRQLLRGRPQVGGRQRSAHARDGMPSARLGFHPP